MTTTSPRRHVLVGTLGLLWNLIGVAMFLMQVTLSPDALAAMPDAQRAVYEATPAWLNGLFAVAVASGVLGSIGLLMRRRWATPALLVSLLAIVVQMLAAYLLTPVWAASGPGGLVLPVLLVLIAFGLWRYAATRRDVTA